MLKSLIISRTDSLGDVILTLPAAGFMKRLYPEIKIYFIGRSYTQPVIQACHHVDEFINWDEVSGYPEKRQVEFFESLNSDAIVHVYPDLHIAKIASRSNIPIRIGTSHRFYHWLYCNKMVPLGRKKSELHESQLNLKLFSPVGSNGAYSLHEISGMYGLTRLQPLHERFGQLLDAQKFNLILHPKSKGSAREWGLSNFEEFINLLPKGRVKIFVSGTNEDRKFMASLLDKFHDTVTDITGQMSLTEFISFINAADGLVAASTGPLHIASALGKVALGLFAPIRPIHPGRWSPIGKNADYLVVNKSCSKCKYDAPCECIQNIKPAEVVEKLLGKIAEKGSTLAEVGVS
jgi:heptosyltransferase III